MSENKPAFPRTQWTGSDKNAQHRDVPGMTMRQWYKGMAMMGLLNRQYLDVPVCPKCKTANDDPGNHYAEIAGAYADAQLAEDSEFAKRNSGGE